MIIIEDRTKIFGKSKKKEEKNNRVSRWFKLDTPSVSERPEEERKGGHWTIKLLFYNYKALRFLYTVFYYYYFPLVIIIIPFAETIVLV